MTLLTKMNFPLVECFALSIFSYIVHHSFKRYDHWFEQKCRAARAQAMANGFEKFSQSVIPLLGTILPDILGRSRREKVEEQNRLMLQEFATYKVQQNSILVQLTTINEKISALVEADKNSELESQ